MGKRGFGPAKANAADDPAQMATHFLARRRLAGPQDDGDGPPGGGVVDVDRQKAAVVIVRVEQGQLLVAVDDIAGVVDVERHCSRGRGMAGAIKVDRHAAQLDDLAQRRGVFPSRQRGLRAQVAASVGQASACQLESGVFAQVAQIVAVLVAAGDGEDAGAQDGAERVGNQKRVARIGNHFGQLVRQPQPLPGLAKKHHPGVRGDAPAIEGGSDFLARDGWKREREQANVGHGGCGSQSRRGWRV